MAMNPEFNAKGTSTVEKRDRAQKVLDARVANGKILFGIESWTPEHTKMCDGIAEAAMYLRHWQGQVDAAEAARKAREAKEAAEAALRKTVSDMAATLGTLDPEKIRAALLAAGLIKGSDKAPETPAEPQSEQRG